MHPIASGEAHDLQINAVNRAGARRHQVCFADFMTRKRFKLSLAALGALAAFFLALIGLLLAPTHASAGKNNGAGHHHADNSDVVVGDSSDSNQPGHSGWHEPDKIDWVPVGGQMGPCAGTACDDSQETPGTQYFGGDGTSGSTGAGGDFGHSHDSGDHDGNGPQGRFAGGFSGGSFGGGGDGGNGPQGGPSSPDESGNPGPGDSGPGTLPDTGKLDPDGTNPGTDDSGPTPLDIGKLDPGGTNPDPDQANPYLDPSPDLPPIIVDDGKPGPDGPNLGPDTKNPDLAPPGDGTHKVPEPLTLSLFAVGLAGAGALRRRNKAKSAL
jgi:PEP-CTERM motif